MARRVVPHTVRWRARAAFRAAHDVATRVRFASQHGGPLAYPHVLAEYERPLVCYPGQERWFEGKCANMRLALAAVDGIVVAPGETFSFWRAVGRPTAARGYARAAALKEGVLTEDVGGAICLASTLLYNIALLAGMQITERRCHSVDTYGPARYFELGRDAGVEHPYIDLRFRNDLPARVMLSSRIDGDRVIARIACERKLPLDATIAVDEPRRETLPPVVRLDPALAPGAVVVDDPGATGLRIVARRIVRLGAATVIDEEWESVHGARARRERRGSTERRARS